MSAARPPRAPFYGWPIVWSMVLIGAMSMALAGPTFGLFIEPMREELGLSRFLFGWTNTGHMLAAGLGGLFIGRLIDRHGARWLLAIAGGVASLALMSLGYFHAPWWIVGAFLVTGLMGIHGPATYYTGPVVAKWFVRERARAMGILSMGAPFGLLVGYPAVQWVILTHGWRAGWIALGMGGLAIIIPVSLLVVRRQPEDIGQRPDGDPPASDDGATGAPRDPEGRQWTRGEAIRTSAFWRITIAYGLFMFSTTSMQVFRFPYFLDQGMDPGLMSVAAGTAQISLLVGALTLGRQVRWVGMERLLGLNMLIMAGCFVLTLTVINAFTMFVSLYMWAWAINALGALQGIIYAAYYGRRHAGAVRSAAITSTLLFSAVAGPVTGYVADLTGGYGAVWWPAVGVLVTAGLLLATSKPPAPVAPHPASTPAPASP